jgi:amino acid transporter
LGVFLGLTFFGVVTFAVSGEAVAGAASLRALFQSDLHITYFILALYVLAVLPNLFGIKKMAYASAALLIFMLGIRWFFGLAGFWGLGDTGSWQFGNLNSGTESWDIFGSNGILAVGLALAFWSFVGIEFAGSLAEEVKEPAKSLPRGIIYGLLVILCTSVVMGLGVTGTAPIAVWQNAMNSAAGLEHEAPQLIVGKMMFGETGFKLMALASVSASLGSLVVVFTTIPRIIFSIARDGMFFGRLSETFGKLHPKYQTPVQATLLSFVVFLLPALYNSAVIDWIFSAAYVWIILYIVYHILSLVNLTFNRKNNTRINTVYLFSAVSGIILTAISLYFAFQDQHLFFGGRALIVMFVALAVTGISSFFNKRKEVPEYFNVKFNEADVLADLEQILPEPDKNAA